MPIYEYECPACGQFEVMQRITDEALTTCETCGGALTKLVSHSSFALKGGGWYKDLYSSSGSSTAASSTPSAATTPSASTTAPATAPASPAPAPASPKPDSGGSKTAA